MKGVMGWLFQRMTGAILIAGLLIHFIIMHYSGPEQISHKAVIERSANPYWKAFNLILLASVIYHGFNGLWGIMLEYVSSVKLLRVLRVSVFAAACLLFAAGTYLLNV